MTADLPGRRPTGMAAVVERLSLRLPGMKRRSVLVGAAVAGSALVTDPKAYALRPQSAYATICGPATTASAGYTVFCATINKGANTCPPGSFAAGWWKAAGSSWCGGGYRYIIDCNASCSKCTRGCSDGICDRGCWSCGCTTGSTATCDQRRNCCNAFRYGQCNTQVKCSGGVHCRVVSCVPPYQWTSCNSTSLRDDSTAEHSTPYLPVWGPIEQRHVAMGGEGGYLKASLGPVRQVGDGRGSFVDYQGGSIYRTTTTGAVAMPRWIANFWMYHQGPKGVLGYPVRHETPTKDGGFVFVFEKGCITDSPSTATQVVAGAAWRAWLVVKRENGVLSYPSGPQVGTVGTGWQQPFLNGMIAGATPAAGYNLWHVAFWLWRDLGGATGQLGHPTADRTAIVYPARWFQPFERGIVIDSEMTTTQAVFGVMWTAYQSLGRWGGDLGYPTAAVVNQPGGFSQTFQGGELWAAGTGPAFAVRGAVLTEWLAQGGASGTYGYPTSHTTQNADGTLTCTFTGGTITI